MFKGSFLVQVSRTGSHELRSYKKQKIFLLYPFLLLTQPTQLPNFEWATQDSRKTQERWKFGRHGESSLLHKASLSGREGALVNDILGVLLFDFAGAVQGGAGEGHETCVGS